MLKLSRLTQIVIFILLLNDNLILKHRIGIVLTVRRNYFDYIAYFKAIVPSKSATATTTVIPFVITSTPGYLFIPNPNFKLNDNIYENNNNDYANSDSSLKYNWNEEIDSAYKVNDFQYDTPDYAEEHAQNETINESDLSSVYEYNHIYQAAEYPGYSIPESNLGESLPIYRIIKPNTDSVQYAQPQISYDDEISYEFPGENTLQPVSQNLNLYEQQNVRNEAHKLKKSSKKKKRKFKEIIKPVTEEEETDEDQYQHPVIGIDSRPLQLANNYKTKGPHDPSAHHHLTQSDINFFHNYYKGNTENLRSSVVFPGTIWCGPGNKAPTDSTFGFFYKTDICCRDHDRCFDTIAPGTTKYGLYNDGMFTKSHCDCDMDFYVCLKKVNTFVSYKVGFAYYNILRPQCFRREHPVLKCVEWYDKRCDLYMLDETRSEKYQWFDNKHF